MKFPFLFDPTFLLGLFKTVLVDLMLAGDNALVIALAVRELPADKQFWGRVWGTVGAVGLRLAFITIVTFLLSIPYLQAVGGLVLLFIALKLVRHSEEDGQSVRAGTSLWEAVWIIVVADVVMSLDNVVAISGAAHGNNLLIALGIAISLPIVVWGSVVLANLMKRFPCIIWIGGGVLGHIGGEMLIDDNSVAELLGGSARALHHTLPWALAAAFTWLGWFFNREKSGEAVPS